MHVTPFSPFPMHYLHDAADVKRSVYYHLHERISFYGCGSHNRRLIIVFFLGCFECIAAFRHRRPIDRTFVACIKCNCITHILNVVFAGGSLTTSTAAECTVKCKYYRCTVQTPFHSTTHIYKIVGISTIILCHPAALSLLHCLVLP